MSLTDTIEHEQKLERLRKTMSEREHELARLQETLSEQEDALNRLKRRSAPARTGADRATAVA